jgi:hypothetical protein
MHGEIAQNQPVCRVRQRKVPRRKGYKWLRQTWGAFGLSFALMSWPLSLMAAVVTPHAVSTADRAAAQALFDQGRELMEQGKPAEACPRFEESQRLDSGLGTQYHLADCYEAVGRLASAHTLFLEVAAQAQALGQTKREEVARQRAKSIAPKLPKLSIEVPPISTERLVIERDGSTVGRAQWGLAVPVDPGLHRVRVSGPGLSPWVTEIDIPGEPALHTISIPAVALEPRQPFLAPMSHKIGLAALGVGVIGLGTSGVFAIEASSKNAGSNRAGCVDNGCPTVASRELRQKALAAGNRATWAFGVGVVGLAAAAVLFWALPEPPPPSVAGVWLRPVADLNGGALRLAGRF